MQGKGEDIADLECVINKLLLIKQSNSIIII